MLLPGDRRPHMPTSCCCRNLEGLVVGLQCNKEDRNASEDSYTERFHFAISRLDKLSLDSKDAQGHTFSEEKN